MKAKTTHRTLHASWNWFTAFGISPHTMLRFPCANIVMAVSAASILNVQGQQFLTELLTLKIR